MNKLDKLEQIQYQLFRSKRKTVAISVDRGKVIVRAPLHAPVNGIDQFVVEKQAWIRKQLTLEAQNDANRIRIQHGNEIYVAEHPLLLVVNRDSQRKRSSLSETGTELIFNLPSSTQSTDAQVYRLFFRWITQRANQFMAPLAFEIASTYSLALLCVKFRRTKTKWGHCTSQGVIQFNPLVMLAPLYVIEYLVAHEVAHLKHAHHGQAFWKLVGQIHPEYQRAERWLKQEGYRLAIELP